MRGEAAFAGGCRIVRRLHARGFQALFAGGWVRDFLMDHPSDDIDIATDAPVEEIRRLFPKTIPVGIRFGIVIVVEEGERFEVATFRKDGAYLDGRHPVGVAPATPREDAQRRDFTINGLFYDPIRQRLFDYVGGREDIEGKVIRAIGDPHKRFLEDRLRIMRAVRYATRFDFAIEEETLSAIFDSVPSFFPAVAIERVWSEFAKMAAYPRFDCALLLSYRLALLPLIFPGLRGVSLEEIGRRLSHIAHFPPEAPLIARVLELFPHASLEEKKELCDDLKLSNRERRFVEFYHRAQLLLLSDSPTWRPCEWAHFYAHPLFSLCFELIALHLPFEEREGLVERHRKRQSALSKSIEKIRRGIPFLTSGDLRRFGVPDGKGMGLLLREGERIAIDEDLHTSREIIAKLQSTPLWRGLVGEA